MIRQIRVVSCHNVVGACSGQVKGQGSTSKGVGNFQLCHGWAGEFRLLVPNHELRLVYGDLFARFLLHKLISPSRKFLGTKISQTIFCQNCKNQVIRGMATLFLAFES